MWPRFGIKIGNSTFCIATIKADGKVDVIANKQGDRVSEACLLWDGETEIECGLTAKQKMATRPKQAVANCLQFIQKKDEVNEEQQNTALNSIPCEYDESQEAFVLKCLKIMDNGDDKEEVFEISPFDVLVKLFQAELELAKQYHDGREQKPIVVLSVPSYYTKDARATIAAAAEKAGFHVAQVLSEPTAALLGYKIGEEDVEEEGEKAAEEGQEQKQEKSRTKYVLTIKSGGLYSHFALYAVEDDFYSLVASFGPFAIGGKQYTEVIVQFICEEFQRKYKLDPHESRRSIAKIRTNAANCKHILSTMPTTQIYIDSLMDGLDFNAQLSRARFDSLIQPVINNFMQILNDCVDKIFRENQKVKKIDSIVLLGATMEIPKLQATIAKRFPDTEILSSMASEEIVAIGCARQALYLVEPNEQELQSSEDCFCSEEDILIWHGEDESNAAVLFNKGIILPNVVHVNVKLNNEYEKEALFKVRIGKDIKEVYLEGVFDNLKDQEYCRLEAEINQENNNNANDGNTIVKLRCL